MRKTRLPVNLNDPTWMTTDAASSTNTPPTITRTNSCLMRSATVPSAPPSASEPTSPMKMSAGYELYQRNPRLAPTSAPQKIVSSPMSGDTVCSCRYSANTRCPLTYASAVSAVAATPNTLMARPSRPSVRFTAFVQLTQTNIANSTYAQPRSGIQRLKNGKTRCVLYRSAFVSASSASPTLIPMA